MKTNHKKSKETEKTSRSRSAMKNVFRFQYSKLSITFMIMLISFLLNGQKPKNNQHLEIGTRFYPQIETVLKKDIRLNDNIPVGIYCINQVGVGNSPKEKAENYLTENWALFGLKGNFTASLKHHVTRTSISGSVVRFRQVFDGYDVDKNEFTVKINNSGKIVYIQNSTIPIDLNFNPSHSIGIVEAYNTVRSHLGLNKPETFSKRELVIHIVDFIPYLAYKINIIDPDLIGDWEAFVDAQTGQIIDLFDISQNANGNGNIFDPDPLTTSGSSYGIGGFVDNSDATNSDLEGEMINVTLLDIDLSSGTYTLNGPWASIVDFELPSKGLFSQASPNFNFNRENDGFEAVMCYYHIDQNMRYMNNTLGISVNPSIHYSGGVQFDPSGRNGVDNSRYYMSNGRLTYGEGGVDDAEDADVILHELGHGIHDWITNGSRSAVEGLNEGCGDYWAQSYSWSVGDNSHNLFTWDGHNEFWPGRTTDYNVIYPGGLLGGLGNHTDGQIWATTLMKIYIDIGREKTDVVFLEGIAMTNSTTNQRQAAEAVYQAAVDLNYSESDLCIIYTHLNNQYTLSANSLFVNIDVTQPSCSLDNGSAEASVNCGTPPFSYLWSTGATTQTIDNLSAGTYSVTVTDDIGNTGDASITLEEEIIVSQANPYWTAVIAQYNLDPNELQNRNIYVESELIIDVDYTFSNVTFGFAQGGRLTIEDGFNVEIKDLDGSKSILKACDDVWSGITVEGNAGLTMNNSKILDASVGISAHSESTIDISGIDIIGNNGRIAVSLRGTVNLTHFGGINIHNYIYGVYGFDNSGYYNFGSGSISNTIYGFYLYNSPSAISNFEINSEYISIYMNNCPGSMVYHSNIEHDNIGIDAINSNSLEIYEAEIGYYTQPGKIGINLNNCSNSEIKNISYINVKNYGIKVYQSNNVTIEGNGINVSGFVDTDGGGIQLINGVDCTIKNNNIDANQCSFGIESIEGFANRILENDVSVFSTISTRTAAIRTLGSVYETINENTINGLANVTGIIAQNSPGNTYICNEITNTVDGLSVFYNSEGQDIWGNKFLDSDIDLSIRSRVGVHYFKGNEFHNGTAKAIDLSFQDINFSWFFVNENIPFHMPTNPDPQDGWFINNPDVWTYFDDCKNESGKGKFYTDEVELSSYFEHIKSLQNSMPEVFFVKLFHLLKYENAKDSFDLPTYIKQDPVFAESCGLLELVNVTTQLSNLSKLTEGASVTEEDMLKIQTLQDQYVLATDESVKQSIINELRLLMNSLKPGFDAEFLADSLAYDNLKYELEAINCTDILVQKWKDIYIEYIDFVQNGEIAPEHQNNLVDYSQDCSDMYGDAIHLVRALTNTFDSTYYDVYDGCLSEPIEPRSNGTNTLNALVLPNPTKSTIMISTEKSITGIVNVFDLSGRIVFSENIKKVNQHTLELKLEDGVYLINIISDTGEKYSKKIVVAK